MPLNFQIKPISPPRFVLLHLWNTLLILSLLVFSLATHIYKLFFQSLSTGPYSLSLSYSCSRLFTLFFSLFQALSQLVPLSLSLSIYLSIYFCNHSNPLTFSHRPYFSLVPFIQIFSVCFLFFTIISTHSLSLYFFLFRLTLFLFLFTPKHCFFSLFFFNLIFLLRPFLVYALSPSSLLFISLQLFSPKFLVEGNPCDVVANVLDCDIVVS